MRQQMSVALGRTRDRRLDSRRQSLKRGASSSVRSESKTATFGSADGLPHLARSHTNAGQASMDEYATANFGVA